MGFKYKKESEGNVFGDSYNEEESLEESDVYYEYDEEISDEDEDEEDLEGKSEELDENEGQGVDLSFACEDCDYRWDDFIVGEKEEIENEEFDVICPMCGSINISQI